MFNDLWQAFISNINTTVAMFLFAVAAIAARVAYRHMLARNARWCIAKAILLFVIGYVSFLLFVGLPLFTVECFIGAGSMALLCILSFGMYVPFLLWALGLGTIAFSVFILLIPTQGSLLFLTRAEKVTLVVVICAAVVACSVSLWGTYQSGVKQSQFFSEVKSGHISASIDPASLITSSANPVLSGSAVGIDSVLIIIDRDGTSIWSETTAVKDGHWSVVGIIPNDVFSQKGTPFTVNVYARRTSNELVILAKGTLPVTSR